MSATSWEVRLRIVSEQRSVAELSALVGIDPDHSIERGTLRHGSSLPRRFSSWEIESRCEAMTDVADHVGDILERIVDRREKLRLVAAQVDGFELSIVGHFNPRLDDNPGMNLTSDHLGFLADVRASLDLEIVAIEPAPARP